MLARLSEHRFDMYTARSDCVSQLGFYGGLSHNLLPVYGELGASYTNHLDDSLRGWRRNVCPQLRINGNISKIFIFISHGYTLVGKGLHPLLGANKW